MAFRILANDGIHADGKKKLENAGFEVITERIEQDDLPKGLQKFDVVLVRSATKIRKELIDQCPDLKLIGRAGVGMDNIDVDYARGKGLKVINTPAASSRSVAELSLGHLINLNRYLHLANREMPERGATEFKKLKKSYAKGHELLGKKLVIIGFGRIGQELGKIALGMGMNVLPVTRSKKKYDLDLQFPGIEAAISTSLQSYTLDEVLHQADAISIHVPSQPGAVLGKEELGKLKKGVLLINTSRGGIIDEKALLEKLDDGTVAGAALDVFNNEPTPDPQLLNHPKISCSPHIGASTLEAQSNIGIELADQIIDHFGE